MFDHRPISVVIFCVILFFGSLFVDKDIMNNDNENKTTLVVLGCLSLSILVPIFMVLSLLVEGFVVMKLWGWFIVPFGLPFIGYLHAAGIALLHKFVCPIVKNQPDKNTTIISAIQQMFGLAVIYPMFVLLVGWILHWLMLTV